MSGIEELFQPLTIFLIWYILPGYLSFFILLNVSVLFTPIIKYRWHQIKSLDKIAFALVVSTFIYYLYFATKGTPITDILNPTYEKLIPLVLISTVSSLFIALAFIILILAVNDLFLPTFRLLIYTPIKRLVFRKDLNKTFFEDFMSGFKLGIGPLYNLLYILIKNALECQNIVEIKLKSDNEPLKGKIDYVKRDFSEFVVREGNKSIYVKTSDINNFSVVSLNHRDFIKRELESLRNIFWIWLIIFIVFLLSVILLKKLILIIILVIVLLGFGCIKFFVIENWYNKFKKNQLRYSRI